MGNTGHCFKSNGHNLSDNNNNNKFIFAVNAQLAKRFFVITIFKKVATSNVMYNITL